MSSTKIKYYYDNASDLPSGLDLVKNAISTNLNHMFVDVYSDVILNFFIASFALFLIYNFIKLVLKK